MDLGIDGRAAIVTGASRGIGLATARTLAVEGARVLMVARGAAGLDEVAGSIDGDVATHVADVMEAGAAAEIVGACEDAFGAADILVNNAGTSRSVPLGELTDDEWNAQWELNVMASMRLMRAAVPPMAEAGCGGLVNAGTPGPVETGLWMEPGGLADQNADRQGVTRDEVLAGLRERIPVGRLGREDEVAWVIAFLCSERASNVAGASWSVDGGVVPSFL